MQLIRALLLRRGFKFIFRTGIGGEGEAVFRSRNVKIPAFFFFFFQPERDAKVHRTDRAINGIYRH